MIWISSLFYLMFIAVLVNGFTKWRNEIGYGCICLLTLLNLSFAAFRFVSTQELDGLGLYRNYPNCPEEYWKTDYVWNFSTVDIPKDSYVQIECDGKVYLEYIELKLWFAGIDYCTNDADLYNLANINDWQDEREITGKIVLEKNDVGKRVAKYKEIGE